LGSGGAKIGNAYLKWAFSEAAVLFLAKCPEGKSLFARIERTHGKAKALSILGTGSDARSTSCWRASAPSTWSAS
jgi:hypothetical protein